MNYFVMCVRRAFTTKLYSMYLRSLPPIGTKQKVDRCFLHSPLPRSDMTNCNRWIYTFTYIIGTYCQHVWFRYWKRNQLERSVHAMSRAIIQHYTASFSQILLLSLLTKCGHAQLPLLHVVDFLFNFDLWRYTVTQYAI